MKRYLEKLMEAIVSKEDVIIILTQNAFGMSITKVPVQFPLN